MSVTVSLFTIDQWLSHVSNCQTHRMADTVANLVYSCQRLFSDHCLTV
jgi:hypothetical protein